MFCQLPKQVFHTWSKWKITSQGKVQHRTTLMGEVVKGSERIVGQYVEQQRHCECCGLTQIKRIETKA